MPNIMENIGAKSSSRERIEPDIDRFVALTMAGRLKPAVLRSIDRMAGSALPRSKNERE